MGRSLRAPSHARRALWTAALAASLIAIASSRCFADHRAVHVGLDIQSRDRKFVVINVWQGSAGDEYGVLVGDIVLAINGSTLNPDDLQAFFDLIRHPGEDMRLELLGVDGGRKSLVLPKDACKPPSGHMAAGTPESPRLDDLPSSSSMDSAPVRLLHPQRNEVTNSRMLSFAWAKVPGAVSYGFELLRPLPYRGSDQVLSAVTDINQFCCFNVPLDWILGRHTYIAYAVTALGPDGAVIARSVPRDGVFVNRDDSIVEDLLSADPPARDSARRRLNRRCYAGRVREAAALARYLETGPPGARAAALEGLARSDVRYQTGWISKAFPLLDDADPAQRRAAHLFIATAIARMRADSFNHGEAFPILASASKHPSLRPDVIAAVDRMGPPPEKEMDTLRRWLEDADPGKRATAASALGLLRSSASFAVPDLLGLGRKDPDPWVRQQAMLALSRAGPAAQAAVPSLRQDLSSPNPESAGNAATALSGIGSGAVVAVGDLISLAERPDTQASIPAIKALGDIGPPANAAVLPLLRLLKDPQRRASCKAALQKIGAPPPSVIPELQTFLSDPDPDLREWGARELGWLGKDAKAAVAALIRMIDDPYATVQIAAMDALGGIGQDASPAVPNLIRAMEGKFSGIGTQAVPHPSGMLVEGVIPGGPAEAEGVRRGDVIVSIDGLETSSMPFYQAWRLLRGAPGTEARIVVQRGGGGGYGGEIIGFLVTRAEMTIPEAAYNGVIPAAIMSLGKIGKPAARALPGLLAILDTDPSRPSRLLKNPLRSVDTSDPRLGKS
ncbi:MAG: HEAT repeat domain-containing protein [Elusimicrobia bacterium]|nr:HEAT repeat domain-containing protein [Elusimicrobiota bacterium]